MDNNDVQLKVGDIATLDKINAINTEVIITPINDGTVTTPKKNEENTVSEIKDTLEQLKENIKNKRGGFIINNFEHFEKYRH